MNKNLFLINQYLKDSDIKIDKKEFDFQFSSHPEYPNLVALSDTLRFFNIPCDAMKVNKSEIDLLPNLFIAKLTKNNDSIFCYIRKEGNTYKCKIEYGKTLELSKDELCEVWDDTIFLVKKEDELELVNKNTSSLHLSSLLIILFVTVIYYSVNNISHLIFCGLAFLGFTLSLLTFKDFFKIKNKILDNFCNISTLTDCDSVINSSKCKMLKKINFRDLSIVFFFLELNFLC